VRLALAVLLAIAAVAAPACDDGDPPRAPDAARSATAAAPVADSNVFARDYVGPARCGDCHADQYARWQRSLHRTMNARADEPGAVIGDFDDATLAYRGRDARFTRDARGFAMTLAGTTYRVTRTIGRRGLQEYVGVRDGDPTATEVRLPFGWWPRLGGWFPQPYYDPWLGDEARFDAFAPPAEPWATRCPWCHSTYPFAQRVARFDALGVGHGPESRAPLQLAGGSDRLDVSQQVTTGISCESCHLGGRAHATGAGPIRFTPLGTAKFADERRDARIVNATCAQCHSGPSPRLVDGTALRNSSEALDLAASPCTTARCTDCHDPHAGDAQGPALPDRAAPADNGAQLAARAIAACTRCHDRLADPDTARAHAGGHGPAVASCLDCHMPRVVMGLDHMIRTHRISSPTDARILGDAGPNACNACHLDQSVAWTARSLSVPLPRTARDLDAPAGETWLADARPALRVFAAAAYARRPALARAELPALARGLTDSLAYVRAWTLLSLDALAGKPLDYDVRAPSAAAAQRLLQQLQ
jgi:hypothetical protein